MQDTLRNFKNFRVAPPARTEALAWLERQERWERRLRELERPARRPVARV